MNRDQVIDLEIRFKIHTNVSNFETVSPKTYKLLNFFMISVETYVIFIGARWPHDKCALLRSERSGFEPWPWTLCCVLGQDTLLSHDGRASHPGGGGGGIEIFLLASCYWSRSKLRPYEPLAGSYADFTFLPTFFQMVGEWWDFVVVTKLIKNFKSLSYLFVTLGRTFKRVWLNQNTHGETKRAWYAAEID